MPIYEYRCTKGHVFDTMQRFTEDPLNKCEVCGAPAQRVFHAPAVHFKGSGFYNTDYGTRNRNREKEAKDGSSASKSDSSSEGSSSDKKESSKSTADSSSSGSSSDKKSEAKATAAK